MEGSFDLFLTLATILPKIGKKYLELFLVFSINVSSHCLQFCHEGEGDLVKKFVWIRVSKQMCSNFHNLRVNLQPIGRYHVASIQESRDQSSFVHVRQKALLIGVNTAECGFPIHRGHKDVVFLGNMDIKEWY